LIVSRIDESGTFRLGSRTVRRIGYGAMQLAGPGVFGPPKDRNHIDTSDFYGPHVTNQLIREALAPAVMPEPMSASSLAEPLVRIGEIAIAR
jgi:hypothetical protein